MKDNPLPPDHPVNIIAQQCGGRVDSVGGPLPDGSGFATVSFPLPKNHWSTKDPDGFNVPPMPLRVGASEPVLILKGCAAKIASKLFGRRTLTRDILRQAVISAAKYAVRASTMNGKKPDYDPDALVGNVATGLLGYHTEDGLSSDSWANPPQAPLI